MKDKKTTKLTCIITGRTLFASKDYYQKKIDKAGSEDDLHKTYICKQAKQLLKKGHDIEYVRESLDADKDFICNITESEIKEIVGGSNMNLKHRLNNLDTSSVSVIKTDPDVKRFIDNILKNE